MEYARRVVQEVRTYAIKQEVSTYAIKQEVSTYAIKQEVSTYAIKQEMSTYAIKQETETFQKLGENSLFLLHWNGSWRRPLLKWLKRPASRTIPRFFFLTLISLVVVLELNPFLSNLPLCQNFSWEDPQSPAPDLPQIQDMWAIMLAIYFLCKIIMVILAHKVLHLLAWMGTLQSRTAWLRGCVVP